MKIGDEVTGKGMAGTGIIRAIKGKNVLIECFNRSDGKMNFCVSQHIMAHDKKQRLRWQERKHVTVVLPA